MEKKVIEPGRFEDFVDWVFAQRGDADISSLDIKYKYDVYRPPGARTTQHEPGYISHRPQERTNRWLRYAMQRVVRSLHVHLPFSATGIIRRILHEEPAVEMPRHGKMSSIIMRLGCHRLQLPVAATAKYEALTELALFSASFDDDEELDGGVRSVGTFVSSCCPRLRKLHVDNPEGMGHLVLRSEALEELSLTFTEDMETLDVLAPSLRVLKLDHCFNVSVVEVSANRLEEVGVGVHQSHYQLGDVKLDIQADLTGVRCLAPIRRATLRS